MIAKALFIPLVAVAVAVGVVASCRRSDMQETDDPTTAAFRATVDRVSVLYDSVMQQARTTIPVVGQITDCYSDADMYISHFASDAQDPIVVIKVGLFQRYVFTVHVPIVLNQSRTTIMSVGEPSFNLYEVESVKRLPDGRIFITHGATQHRFGLLEWNQIHSAACDFAVAGYQLVTNAPIARFADVLDSSGF